MWRSRRSKASPRPTEAPDSPAHVRIAASRLFDVGWYELQLGRTFPGRDRAIRHYLRRGHALASPHPLFEPAYLAAQGFRPGPGGDPLSSYLADEEANESLSPHPLFDVGVAAALAGRRVGHEGVLERWLARSNETDPLPSGDRWRSRPLTRGEFDELAREVVQECVAQRGLDRASRLYDSLEEAAAQVKSPLSHGDVPADDHPLVSIVLPTYDRAGRLEAAISSVQAQAYSHWELLVVDHAPHGATMPLADRLAPLDDRIRVVPGRRAGLSAAWNAGLAGAGGEFVAFLDPGSRWEPGYLAAMVSTMLAQGWDVGHAIQKVVGQEGVSFRAYAGAKPQLLATDHVDLNGLVVRRRLLVEVGGFDESLPRGMGYDLALRLADRTDLQVVPVVAVAPSEDQDADRIDARESRCWDDVVREKHLVDWDPDAAEERVPGRVSVVLPMHKGAVKVVRWLGAVLDSLADDTDLEVVLVGSGSDLASYRLAASLVRARPLGKTLRTPRNVGWPVAVDLGVASSTGEYVTIVHPRAVPAEGELVGPLLEALESGADFSQPVVLECENLVRSAGAGFADRGGVPYPLLSGHNVRDVPHGGRVRIPAVLSPVFAARAATVVEHRGMDPLTAGAYSETELSMRAHLAGDATSVLVPEVSVVDGALDRTGFPAEHAHAVERLRDLGSHPPDGTREFWRLAGFDVLGHDLRFSSGPEHRLTTEGQPHPRLRPVDRSTGGVPSLRWAIQIATPAGLKGREWGDLHFARSLAAALERRGQHVGIDFRDARGRESQAFDDVVLVLRGLDEVTPRPGRVNLLWVISHPELVSEQECRRFDRVFAAATSWSRRMSDAWRMPVVPLLQCTDPELFHPGRRDATQRSEILFVGNSRKVVRPSVRGAMNHGHAVDVYGADWHEYVPPAWIKADGVANTEVGALYASAGVVLNDHWDDMREQGFLSNRLFDAVACGARVVSDPVEGIDDIFRGSVQTFRSDGELDRLLSADWETAFPDECTRRETAGYIAREHSFDARAGQLLEHVTDLRGSG